jgi:hypothetical protein
MATTNYSIKVFQARAFIYPSILVVFFKNFIVTYYADQLTHYFIQQLSGTFVYQFLQFLEFLEFLVNELIEVGKPCFPNRF